MVKFGHVFPIRGVFIAQSNVYDGACLRVLALNYFPQNAPSLLIDWVLNTRLRVDSFSAGNLDNRSHANK